MKKPIIISSTGSFDEAIEVLRRGGVIAYPTETFYGLAVDPFNETALRNLFSLKGRASTEPISVIIGDINMLDSLAREVPPRAMRLIEEFWPGPLTIVLHAKDTVPDLLTGKDESGPTIGVRMPGCVAARRLSAGFDGPITATSANPSGRKSPVQLSEVLDYFDARIEIIIDGDGAADALKGTLGSTVVELVEDEIRIIREGEIKKAALEGF